MKEQAERAYDSECGGGDDIDSVAYGLGDRGSESGERDQDDDKADWRMHAGQAEVVGGGRFVVLA